MSEQPNAIDPASAPPADYFAFMGMPRRLHLDERMLQTRYYDLSRRHHPDFHTAGDDAAREESLVQSSITNRAYRTLKDPFERARHLLALEWPSMTDADRKRIPPSLLFEVMEMQEAIADAGPAGNVDPARAASLRSIGERLEEKLRLLRGDLDAIAAEWDAFDDGSAQEARMNLLRRLNELLNTRNYLRTLLGTIDAAINGGPALRH